MVPTAVTFPVTTIVSAPVHPAASVTVTEYVPPVDTEMACVNPPVDQRYEAALIPAFKVVGVPLQMEISGPREGTSDYQLAARGRQDHDQLGNCQQPGSDGAPGRVD